MMSNHVWWFGLHNIQKVILRGMYLLLFKLWLKKDPLSNFGARTKRTWDCHPGSHNRDTEVPTTTRSLGLQSMSSRCAFPASKLSRTSYWLMLGNQQGWPTGGSTTKPVASFRSSQRSTERSKGWCWGINKAGRLADQPQNPWHRSARVKDQQNGVKGIAQFLGEQGVKVQNNTCHHDSVRNRTTYDTHRHTMYSSL